ncbi:MAG TPA: peptidoglycan DD-metalloendopeptidase family protein [Gemmatimonadales bacterium]|jgi:septal ring factor EnvC (AmiA/AmiB activator)|nr:peptidoglycan DD-metalloendopeptidase family protein [Gemmatimonadales bacterium]
MSRALRRYGGTAVRNSLACLGFLLVAAPSVVAAQNNVPQQLEESRRRIDQIRREREQLQEERTRLQGQAHTLDQELSNIERQRETTNRIVNELESQIGGLNVQVDKVSSDLALAEDNLAEKRAVLSRRLVDIYKRGPLYGFQVMLAAESFGDLLSRYKYLYLTSRQDRTLLTEVESLRDRVQRQRQEVVQMRSEFSRRRAERETELQNYGTLANERSQRLRQVQGRTRSTEQRLSDLERDENRLNDLLATLERNRRAGEAGTPVAGSLTTSDIGKLDWPVDGNILYPFGRVTLPSGGVIRRNGIGIAASPGTAVKAVESGTVEFIQRLSTYGLTLGIQHGNGYRSLYMHLGETRVAVGAAVARGQVIATVGEATSDEGSQLYFEIRGENGIALDPADWLRRRR